MQDWLHHSQTHMNATNSISFILGFSFPLSSPFVSSLSSDIFTHPGFQAFAQLQQCLKCWFSGKHCLWQKRRIQIRISPKKAISFSGGFLGSTQFMFYSGKLQIGPLSVSDASVIQHRGNFGFLLFCVCVSLQATNAGSTEDLTGGQTLLKCRMPYSRKLKLLEKMLEENLGMRRLSIDWKCQSLVCFVLRRLWSIWADVFGFRKKTAAWSLEAVPTVPHSQEPFCAVSTLFSNRKLFHRRVSI